MAKLRMHTQVRPLPGTDDRVATVTIDRAVPRIGGIWITYRAVGAENQLAGADGLVRWDEHGEMRLLSAAERVELRAAARAALAARAVA